MSVLEYLKENLNDDKKYKSADEIIDFVYDIHRNPDDFEDDEYGEYMGLINRIKKYDNYQLKDVDVSDVGGGGMRCQY